MSLHSAADDFPAIAASLREEVLGFYERRGERLDGEAGRNTLETNSGFVLRRGEPLERMVLGRLGRPTLEGLRLVDLGCGFGALSVFFAARGASVTAIDPNEARFEVGRAVAEHHGLPVCFTPGRMQHLELEDGGFDVAVQNNSLCYVVDEPDRLAALAETVRILRPGGVVVLRNPNRWHPRDQFTRLPLVHVLPVDTAAVVSERFGRTRSRALATSPRRLAGELRAVGFESVVHHPARDTARSRSLKLIARYHHLTALGPG